VIRPFRTALPILPVLASLIAAPLMAENWREIGNSGSSLDKVWVDTDSIRTEGAFRTARIMVTFSAARPNSAGLMLDRLVHTDGFDCAAHKAAEISTVGYLGQKIVGHSPIATDWQTKMKPVSGDGTSARGLALVCAASVAAPVGPDGKPKPQFTTGSGIFVNTDGLVLTNAHVVRDCKTIGVKALGVPPVVGAIDTVDPVNDLALVRTHADYGAAAVFRVEKRPAQLGEGIGVIGYPLAGTLSSEPKATFGEVSSVAGINNDYTKLQFSAPIQPGNSGGPVFDRHGQVIGVVVATASTALMASIGMVTQNVNFAIKGEIAQIFMNAHGVRFRTANGDYALETAQIAESGEKTTAQILCMK